MAHVLIGFAEALPAPEVVFSLLAAGHQVSAFTRLRKLPLAHLPLENLHILPAPENGVAQAIAGLQALMGRHDAPDIVLPLDDPGLWLTSAALSKDPRVAGATGTQVEIALDKRRQIEAAQCAGLAVPETRILHSPGDLELDFPLPAIVKPAFAVHEREGRLGKGRTVYLLDREADHAAAARLIEDDGPALLQPLIHGIGEGVFGFAEENSVTVWSGHRRLRMMNPHGSGSSACISATPDAALYEPVKAFLKNIGWRGPFMLEFLRGQDGTPWFMELNGRMWGSLALARRQGLEYPAWAVARALDPAFCLTPPDLPATPIVQRNLGRELLHLLFVLRGPKSEFHRTDWPRFISSLVGVLTPAHPRQFYNYDPTYRTFFLRDALWTIGRTLRR